MKKLSKNKQTNNNTTSMHNYVENDEKQQDIPKNNAYCCNNMHNNANKLPEIIPQSSSKNDPLFNCTKSNSIVDSNNIYTLTSINDNFTSDNTTNVGLDDNAISKPVKTVHQGTKNLIPITERDEAQQKAMRQEAGRKSQAVQKKKKSLQELFKIIGQMPLSEKDSAMEILKPHKDKFEALGIELTQDVALTFCNQAVAQTNPQMAKLVYQMRQELPAEKAVITTTELDLNDDRLLSMMSINNFGDEE